MNSSFLLRILKLCWSDHIKVFCFKLFIDVIISFWISLSKVHLAIFAFVDLLWYLHVECFSCQFIQNILSYFDFSKTLRCLARYFGFDLIPSCLTFRWRWLTLPEIGIPSHLWMCRFALLSRFCTIQVSGR